MRACKMRARDSTTPIAVCTRQPPRLPHRWSCSTLTRRPRHRLRRLLGNWTRQTGTLRTGEAHCERCARPCLPKHTRGHDASTDIDLMGASKATGAFRPSAEVTAGSTANVVWRGPVAVPACLDGTTGHSVVAATRRGIRAPLGPLGKPLRGGFGRSGNFPCRRENFPILWIASHAPAQASGAEHKRHGFCWSRVHNADSSPRVRRVVDFSEGSHAAGNDFDRQ
jgi:hypothetical protein